MIYLSILTGLVLLGKSTPETMVFTIKYGAQEAAPIDLTGDDDHQKAATAGEQAPRPEGDQHQVPEEQSLTDPHIATHSLFRDL